MANLVLTTACSLSCDYCFTRGVWPPGAPRELMSLHTFEGALDFLERSGIREARLLGGEPTLHPDFPQLARSALDRGFRLQIGRASCRERVFRSV